MKITQIHLLQVISIIAITSSLIFIHQHFKKENLLNDELDKPSKLFFEGLYEGFNYTPNFETINKVNRFNLNLTLLDEHFIVLGQSMIYPEKQRESIQLIHDFFYNLKNSIAPQDEEGQYILNQHISIFETLEIFQSKSLRSFFENQISPLLFYWDAQDLFPYGLYKEYGINLVYTLKLMIFDD